MGVNCDTNDVCTQPINTTPKCRALNFLDRTMLQDNQQFLDEDSADGFVQGDVFDTEGNLIVNDRLLPITYKEIMPLLEQRVVSEVLTCLQEYKDGNNGRYPWAAKLEPGAAPDYHDDNGERFGRVPDGQSGSVTLDDTRTAIGPTSWDYWPNKGILTGSNCKLTSNVSPKTWWLNWKELVFYKVAGGFEPAAGSPACGPVPNNCLTVNPPSPAADKQVVVIAAGRALQGQLRTNDTQKSDPRNYLEDDNADYVDDGVVTPNEDVFASKDVSDTFNDVVCKQGIC